ncbi:MULTISPECIES: hypothetical protein [unclassified Streptomyces]|uniref:hypothetical protein n=1 Tax=unclassified Streptomyces TaxID=2593676 RepID=UPI00131B8D0D|nr:MULTISPECIES: hypothetical protein [unclassified Streptomyces]
MTSIDAVHALLTLLFAGAALNAGCHSSDRPARALAASTTSCTQSQPWPWR